MHDQRITEIFHKQHSSILCLLKDLVHNDLGEGHLEHFLQSHAQDFNEDITTISFDKTALYCTNIYGPSANINHPCQGTIPYLFLEPPQFTGPAMISRGPPVIPVVL